ncbi:MAG: PTS IIA-like nitrogen regulatory protein PtsN [Pseudomonadota bacterium]
MEMSELLTPDAVLPAVKSTSKKHVFQEIAARMGEIYGLPSRRIFDALNARERLGSTAMGYGVAIPHARIEGLDRIAGLFARLEHPLDFDAADGKGVDLMMVLLAPEDAGADHLRALAKVSRLLRENGTRSKLRQTPTGSALFALLTEPAASRAA